VVRAIRWYDWSWTYRRAITITSSAALTNYQVKVTVNTATPIGAGKMKANGDDIRFTNYNDTLLDYWIDTGINTASTVIWVKVDSIANGTTTIYMYYGNAAATGVSNGANTFIMFDDFETGISGWTAVGTPGTGGGISQSSAQKTHGTYSAYINDANTSSAYGVYKAYTSQSGVFAVDYDIRPVQNSLRYLMQIRSDANLGPNLRLSATADGSDVEYSIGGTFANLPTPKAYSANTWYSFSLEDIRVNGSPNDTFDVWIAGTQHASDILWNANHTSANRIYFMSGGAVGDTPKVYVDAVRVRAWSSAVTYPLSYAAEESL